MVTRACLVSNDIEIENLIMAVDAQKPEQLYLMVCSEKKFMPDLMPALTNTIDLLHTKLPYLRVFCFRSFEWKTMDSNIQPYPSSSNDITKLKLPKESVNSCLILFSDFFSIESLQLLNLLKIKAFPVILTPSIKILSNIQLSNAHESIHLKLHSQLQKLKMSIIMEQLYLQQETVAHKLSSKLFRLR